MYLTQSSHCRCATLQSTSIDPFLDGDMGFGFKLQVPFLWVSAVVLFQGALDINRMRVMTLDQVTVITIHRPDRIGECREHSRRQTAA